MRRKPDPEVETGKPQHRADFWREPWVGRRQRRPHALVQSAENHQIGMLQPRFEQAPDEYPWVATVRRAHRARVEQVAQQRDPLLTIEDQVRRIEGGFEFGDQLRGEAPVGSRPGADSGKGGGSVAKRGGKGRQAERCAHRVHRLKPGSNRRPRILGILAREMRIEPGQP